LLPDIACSGISISRRRIRYASDDMVINDARKTNADVTTTSSIVDPFFLPSNHRRYPARPGLRRIIERQFRSV